MRPGGYPGEFDALDAAEELDLFELGEMFAANELRLPRQFREGLDAGRLKRDHGTIRRIVRRLAYRSFSRGSRSGFYVSLRCPETGARMRLPFE